MKESRTPKRGKWGLVVLGMLMPVWLAGCSLTSEWGGSAFAAGSEDPVLVGDAAAGDGGTGQTASGSTGGQSTNAPSASPSPSPAQSPSPSPEPSHQNEAQKQPKRIALTFDDGPDGKYTPQVLDILKQYGVKATFFLVGQQVKLYPETAKRIAYEGHEIGNHSWSHKHLPKLAGKVLDEQVVGAQVEIAKATGVTPTLLRAPYGELSDEFLNYLHEQGMQHVYWTIDTKDWAGTPVAEMRKNVAKHARSGGVILLHSFGGKKNALEHTLTLLPLIIEDLQKEGYQLSTVGEMIDADQIKASVVK